MRLSYDEMIFYQNSFKIKASERTLRLKMMVEARGVEPLSGTPSTQASTRLVDHLVFRKSWADPLRCFS